MNPLDQLRDIHLPSDVDWWPLAPGWWVLMLLVVIGLFLLIKWWRNALKRKQHFKQVMSAVDGLAAELHLDDKAWLERLSALLRQLAINLHGRKATAGLVGIDWLEYLDHSGQTDQFSQGPGRVLANAPYQQSVTYDRSELLGLARQWLATQTKQGGVDA